MDNVDIMRAVSADAEDVYMLDVMIVGGGPAGMTAGLYAARMGLSAAVMEQLMVGGQASTTSIIENYPGYSKGIGGPELMMEFQQQAESAGCEVRYDGIESLELSGDVKRARTAAGEVEARTVILCMGAQARKLDVPGEDLFRGRGVSYCATCDGALYRGQRALVVGGGNTAAEDALYLAALCEKVYVVHRRDALRADAALARRIAASPNIEMVWNSVVTGFEGAKALERAHIRDVKTGAESVLEVSGAFIAVGQTPQSELVRGQLELDGAGFIVAGEDTLTSIPGVFAAGDIRAKALRQVITAAADGAVAASMAGKYLMMS